MGWSRVPVFLASIVVCDPLAPRNCLKLVSMPMDFCNVTNNKILYWAISTTFGLSIREVENLFALQCFAWYISLSLSVGCHGVRSMLWFFTILRHLSLSSAALTASCIVIPVELLMSLRAMMLGDDLSFSFCWPSLWWSFFLVPSFELHSPSYHFSQHKPTCITSKANILEFDTCTVHISENAPMLERTI